MRHRTPSLNRSAAALCLVAGVSVLSGCFPIMATGIAVGALVATDRRTVGAQTEDTEIEIRSGRKISENYGSKVTASVTSFNRVALITGHVPDEATRLGVAEYVKAIPNVRAVINEAAIGFPAAVSTAANDTLLTARVKAAFIEDKELDASALKIVTESGVVHLMGLVTQAEGKRAGDVAARVSGVVRVVKAFEFISPSELKALAPAPMPADKSGEGPQSGAR